MMPMTVRGVPKSLMKDAWWMAADSQSGVGSGGAVQPAIGWAVWLLPILVIVADRMLWVSKPGLGFAVFVLAVALAAQLTLRENISRHRAVIAWGILALSLVPVFDLVQGLSVMFAALGLLTFCALMIVPTLDWAVILRVARRLPGASVVQTLHDARTLRPSGPSRATVKKALADWAVPVGLGSVFLLLFAVDNPLVGFWVENWDIGFDPTVGRIVFWMLMAGLIWPYLRLKAMAGKLTQTPAMRATRKKSGLVNDRSVVRALVVFNLIFGLQSILDLGYLWGGNALPDGMTYAQYAHSGAYPLLIAALLAGGFALIAQPFLGLHRAVRVLLYLWVGQTVLLVVSSILRLDLYIDAYGLTRLRFAALIWMGLVALGLVLMIVQMVSRQSIGWFMARATGLGIGTLYLCSLVNIDGYVARDNLERDKPDHRYVCQLSEGALPAIALYRFRTGLSACGNFGPQIAAPADWREWGYRNARLRRNLAVIQAEAPQ